MAPCPLLWFQSLVTYDLEQRRKDKSLFKTASRNVFHNENLGEGAPNKKVKKKLTSVSFMYVCVAENAELLVF